MYCRYCGSQFDDPTKTKHSCENCLAITGSVSRPKVSKRYCLTCGCPMPKKTITDCYGVTYSRHTNAIQCSACKIDNPVHVKYKAMGPNAEDVLSISHIKAVKKWAKNNPEKTKASSLARYHTGSTKVLYECRCNAENKVFHHFDYSRPHEVLLLCPDCHRMEHKRLKNLEQPCNSKCS